MPISEKGCKPRRNQTYLDRYPGTYFLGADGHNGIQFRGLSVVQTLTFIDRQIVSLFAPLLICSNDAILASYANENQNITVERVFVILIRRPIISASPPHELFMYPYLRSDDVWKNVKFSFCSQRSVGSCTSSTPTGNADTAHNSKKTRRYNNDYTGCGEPRAH